MEGAPFLTRAAFEKAISKGTAQQFVVVAEQQVDQQWQLAADRFLQEFEPKASTSSNAYADLQVEQPAVIASTMIKGGRRKLPIIFCFSVCTNNSPSQLQLEHWDRTKFNAQG